MFSDSEIFESYLTEASSHTQSDTGLTYLELMGSGGFHTTKGVGNFDFAAHRKARHKIGLCWCGCKITARRKNGVLQTRCDDCRAKRKAGKCL